MEIVAEKLGPVAFDLALVEGKLVIKVDAGMEGVAAGLNVAVDAGHFLDKLKAIIPGGIDDAVIELIKVALVKA